jgi:predicted ester cyclase
MTVEENKAIVRRFYESFAANDEAGLEQALAPELEAYTHNQPDPQGRDAHLAGIRMWNGAFADTRFTIGGQIAEGDEVVTLLTMHASHTRGEFQGLAPSGRHVEVTGVSVERIKDGRIAHRRVISDWLGMLQQLGITPPPTGAN